MPLIRSAKSKEKPSSPEGQVDPERGHPGDDVDDRRRAHGADLAEEPGEQAGRQRRGDPAADGARPRHHEGRGDRAGEAYEKRFDRSTQGSSDISTGIPLQGARCKVYMID